MTSSKVWSGKMLEPIILYLNGRKLFKEYEPVPTEEDSLETLHPLLIPLVIQKVTSELGTADLLTFRSVCRAWHSEATPLLRRRLHHQKIHPDLMRSFLRVWRQARDPPVTSFAFQVDTAEQLGHLKLISEFLGGSITSLRLTIASQEIPSLPTVLQNFRSLEQLTLLRIPEKALPPAYRKYDRLQDDLNLPNLTSIVIGSRWPNLPFVCNYDNFLLEIISGSAVKKLEFLNWRSSLQQIFKFAQFRTLKTLHLTGNSTKESEIATLTRRKLGLEQLKITLGPNIRYETLRNFFKSLGDTLQVLDVTSETSSADFPVTCDLPKLQVLRFQGYKSKLILDDFPTQFPQLESLEILDFEFISFTDYRRKGSSKVKALIARPATGENGLAELNMASLAAAFPNVTKFHGAYMSDSVLNDTIFKYWTSLQVLCLCPAYGLTDVGVTGIPIEVLRATDNVCWCGKEGLEFVDNRSSHIQDLVGLQSLAILEGSLTNYAFLHGIFGLKNLEDLSLDHDVVKSLCLECLRQQLPKLRRLHLICKGPDPSLDQLKASIPHVQVYLTSAHGR